MEQTPPTVVVPPDEQLLFAKVLAWGARAGFVVLVATFAVYLAGLTPVYVHFARLPEVWSLNARAYLAATGTPAGWGWLRHLDHGEFANLAGIAILAGCSLMALGAVAWSYRRRGDRAYALITLAIIAVMVVAASGILNRANH